MTKEFETDALHYLLDEMDAAQRGAFEETLRRFPAAQLALHDCSDLLGTLRRQALDLPFFGDVVSEQVDLVTQPAERAPHRRVPVKMPELVTCHD